MRSLILCAALLTTGCAGLIKGKETEVIVIAHRGASGQLPEHTLEAYKLAILQGADYIEPDLVMTRDGHLIARHDPWLSDSTDVGSRPEFAERRRTLISPEGELITDWWSWDFTLAELKTLRARQVRPDRSRDFDDLYSVPTIAEIIALAASQGTIARRNVGLYPEAKWPAEHAREGLDMAGAFETALRSAGLNERDAKVFVQSFEPGFLMEMNGRIETPLVQLVYPKGWMPGATANISLEEIADYADGVGPYKDLIMDPETGKPTGYGERACELGLEVHPWTFRDDDLPEPWPTAAEEIRRAVAAGATGIFTDFPDTGRLAVTGIARPCRAADRS